MISTTHLLPPGKYFIGDPSFVLDESWQDVLDRSREFSTDMPVSLNDRLIWAAVIDNDAQGYFTDQNDVEYPVQEFYFGAIPIELVENPEGEEHGTVIDAPCGVLVSCTDGVFRFNDIVINTNEAQADPGGGYDLDPSDDHFI